MTKAERQAIAKEKAIAKAKALLLENGLVTSETTTPVVVVPAAAPVVVADRNIVVFSLKQDTTKPAKRKNALGEYEEYNKEVKHFWEAKFESEDPIETAPLSEWILSNLANYQIMQQFQGKSRFDTSLPIVFDMTVNNINALMGVKFSTNAKTIEKLITKAPSIMTRVFNPTSTVYTVDSAKRLANRNELKGFLEGSLNATLAEGIKKLDPAKEAQEIIAQSSLTDVPVEE